MLLRLTDGATTLTLSGAGAYLGATYFPTNQAGAARITETFPLILEGTESVIRAAVQDVQQLFSQARARDQALTARVFVEFRPTDTGDIFRSEIFDGDASYAQPPAERSLAGALNTVRVVVTWTRAGRWEGPEEEIQLASSSQSERTGGVSLTINDNAGTPNWAHIAAGRIKGTQPAPVRLRINNSSGSALAWRNFHVGLNAFSAPASADLWLLATEAVAGATASWGAGVTHNSLQWLIPLSSTLLGQAQGRTFRVLAAWTTITSNAATGLRATVGAYISSVFVPTRVGQERTSVRELQDLGEFPIPPGGYNVGNAAAALAITARSAQAGGGTLDFVMLLPTDSYRRFSQIGYTLANGDAIEDDGVEGGAYWLTGSNRYSTVRAAGAPLTVFPEREQRLYIMADEDSGWNAGRTVTVRAWYRPVYDNV